MGYLRLSYTIDLLASDAPSSYMVATSSGATTITDRRVWHGVCSEDLPCILVVEIALRGGQQVDMMGKYRWAWLAHITLL